MRHGAARLSVVSALLAICIGNLAAAGTIRHDRNDSLYTDLAAMPDFQAVGLGRTNAAGGLFSGTLIAPRWVLTSAHNVPLPQTTSGTFEIGGTVYAADQFIPHPNWGGALAIDTDLALVRLASPVIGITPAPLYRGSAELGKTATLVGFGRTGTGLTGAVVATEGAKRAGQNVIDALGSAIEGSDDYMLADFDSPMGNTSATGSRFPLNLEYHSALGDSGSGIFLDTAGVKQLAGVTSFIVSSDGVANARYGELDGILRVSRYAAWIDEQITPAPTWNVDASGNWSQASNWTEAVPNAAGARAVLGGVITAPRTVTLDTPITVGRIDFDNANSYTVAGTNTLMLDAAAGSEITQLNLTRGSHVISAAISLADDATVDVAHAAGALSLTGGMSGPAQSLSKTGAGSLNVSQIRVAELSIDGGNVALTPHNSGGGTAAGPSVIGALSIAGPIESPTARLDLNNAALVIDYAATSPSNTVRQQLLAGRGGAGLGNGNWAGTGITSSAAAAANVSDPESRSVGYAENGALPLGPYTNFYGQPVDNTSILMAYTRTGDANLDGIVNDDDVTILSATYAPGAAQPHWALGDFDYNGFVDDDDVTLLGVFYDPTATPLITNASPAAATDASAVAAVPEPASVALVIFAALVMAGAGRLNRGNGGQLVRLACRLK